MSDTLYSGSSYSNSEHAWEAILELARSLIRFNDEHNGEDCAYVRVDVDKGRRVDSYYRKENIEVRTVRIEFEMPAELADAALVRAGALKLDDKLGEDQAARFALLELD